MTRSARLPLSREQFQDALRKGLGRAMLHVRQFGTDGLEDDLLHACLHSLLHDPEMENTRGFWLFMLLKGTPHLEVFREPILAKLKNATPETVPYWDAYQLMNLAFNYAGDGSKRAYQIIYEKFGEQLYAPEVGGHQIIMLDGLSGFLHIAEVVGARLKREVDFRDNGGILWSVEDQFGKEQVTQALAKRSKASPNVAAFEHLVNQQRVRKPDRSVPTLSEFLTAVEHDGDVPWLSARRFARSATAEELDVIFSRLLRETEPSRLVSYLEVFAYAKLPRLDDRMFELARSADDAIRDNAVTALAQVKSPAVRELGLRLLEEQDLDRRREGIELLYENHKSKDMPRIAAALPKAGPPDVLHGMATKLMMITDRQPRDVELAKWVYEYNPCSFCRSGAFDRLVKRDALTTFQLTECAWDADDEIRTAARRLIRERRGD